MDALPLDGLIDALPDSVLLIDTGGVIRGANATAEDTFGWDKKAWIGRNLAEGVHPDDLAWAFNSLETVVTKQIGTPIELRIQATDGWRLVEVIGRPIDLDGSAFVLLTIRDLTQRRGWEVAANDLEGFRAILQNSASITMLAGPDGAIRSASMAFTRLTGRGIEAAIGAQLSAVVVAEDAARLRHRIECMVEEGTQQASLEVRLQHLTDAPIPCQFTIVNLLDDPTVAGFVVSAHDISELWRTRAELEHLARHDTLTGLPNRSELEHDLARLLERPGSIRAVVAFIDLDRFKPVNDLYGHDAGDDLLVEVANRLRQQLRDDDLVARLGGDEFVVVARSGTGIDQMHRRLSEAFVEPFELSIGDIHVSASIGLAEARSGDDVDTILAEADLAMYTVKHNLGAANSRTVSSRRRLAEQVRQAFETGAFEAHYQPIVDLDSHSWRGFETLVRWNHPERGLLSPADFLGVVEDTGQAQLLGRSVLDSIGADLAMLNETRGMVPEVTLNASADEVADPDYSYIVTEALDRWNLPPSRLTIEISERSILGRGGHSARTIPANLAALNDAGVAIAVDDFGTGFSSLHHLIAFPISMIKVDRSFVRGVTTDSQRRSVIAALAGLAENSGMRLVAEGIETVDQLQILRDLGCVLGQGYYFARPMPIEAVAERLGSHRAMGVAAVGPPHDRS